MPSGNECPKCGENIGIWAVFRAPLPNRIRCPHCGERLQYGDTALTILAAVVFLIAVIGTAVGAAYVLDAEHPAVVPVVLLGTLILGGLAGEVVFVLVLWCGSYRLESVNNPKSEWDDEF